MEQSAVEEEEVVEVQGKAEDPNGTHMAHSCHHPVGLMQNIGQDICYYLYLYSVELAVTYRCPLVV